MLGQVLECDWVKTLPVYNSQNEISRVKKINRRIPRSVYPLTREFLNSYFDNNQFNISSYSQTFYRDCAASMYSFFLMTYGYTPGSGGSQAGSVPSVPGGQGISYGFNPFFGLFDVNSPWLWILLLIGGFILVKNTFD